MSLLSEAMTPCVLMDKTTKPDGEGGVVTTYVDGAEFRAAIVLDTSMEARAAQQAGVKSVYTVTTEKSVVLQYHDVFRRLEDGKVFRATSDGDDKATPDDIMRPDKNASVRYASYRLNMRQVTAEEWSVK